MTAANILEVPRTPAEAGLPEKFSKWRIGQEEAIALCLNSDKRFKAICKPTGGGKSVDAVATALLSGRSTLAVTANKALQDQYMREFCSIGMVELRGKDNYKCHMNPLWTCEDGQIGRCPYSGTVGCPYSQAEIAMSSTRLGVTNYAKWTMDRRGQESSLTHFEQVVFDEAHNMPDAISSAMELELNRPEVEKILKLEFPTGMDVDDLRVWKDWAINAKPVADAAYKEAAHKLENPDPKLSWIRHYRHMKNLYRRISLLASARGEWVAEEDGQGGYTFIPVSPGMYAESALYMGVKHIVCMSATLRPKTMGMSGLAPDKYAFREFPSSFDPERCPVYYIPTMRVDVRQGDLSPLWVVLDQIISRRKHLKGIIHTVSFDRQDQVLAVSRYRNQMMGNRRGEPSAPAVLKFKQSPAGTIFIGPSVGEGFDFPDDECRWQFMAKIPFAPPSRILKAREDLDKEYRSYNALQTMVQAFGRGMRSNKDWCESFICDSHMDWFLPRYRHLAPGWFHNFFTQVRIVPAPLKVA